MGRCSDFFLENVFSHVQEVHLCSTTCKVSFWARVRSFPKDRFSSWCFHSIWKKKQVKLHHLPSTGTDLGLSTSDWNRRSPQVPTQLCFALLRISSFRFKASQTEKKQKVKRYPSHEKKKKNLLLSIEIPGFWQDSHMAISCSLLLMAEILHHLGCMKPYK